MKNIQFILTAVAMSVCSLAAWAEGTINIPQASAGEYILIGNASVNPKTTAEGVTLTKCQVDGTDATSYTIGSTGAQTQIDFALTATEAGDYIFSFMSGSNGYTAKLSLSLKNSSSEEVWSGTANVINNSTWTLTSRHLFAVGNLSADSYTMTIKVTEQAQDGGDKSFAGNYGNFCFHTATQYPWPSSSALNMEHGTFVKANWNSDNVINNIRAIGASIDNLIVYNNTESFYKFCFNITYLKQNSKVGITITDVATGNVEINNQTLEVTTNGDKMIRLPYALSTGFKKIRFDFTDNDLSSEDQYLYNFQTVTLPAIPSLPLYGTGYLDLSAGTFGRTASAKYDHDPQYESGNDNIGFNGDGGYAEYYVGNTNPADYYELHLGTNRYQEDATFSITITDVATDSEEVNQDFAVPSGSSYADLTCVLYNKITPGLKKIRIETHSSSSSYAFNYNHVCFRSIPALPIESALDLEHGTYNNAMWNSDNVISYIKTVGASIDNLYIFNGSEGFYKLCFNIAHLKQNSKVGITITDMATGEVEINNQTMEITSTGDKEIRFTNALSVGLKKIRFDFTDADSEHTDEHLFNFQTVTLPAVTYDPLPQTTVATMDLNQAGVTFNNCSYEAGNSNIGFIKNGSYADNYYIYNTNPTAHYTLCAGIPWYKKGGKFKITVTDVATGNIEVDAQESPTITATGDVQFNLTNTITSGLKKIRFDFVNEGETDYLFNLNNVSFYTLTLTYDDNGGSGGPGSEFWAPSATNYLSITEPTRAGYSFAGWNEEEDGSGATTYAAGDVFTMPTTNTTLYATWKFVIYRTGDAPDGGAETFAGGAIDWPIEYRMKVNTLDQWNSLYLPFTVDAIKVIEDGVYYDIQPYYRPNVGDPLYQGHYIIRTPAKTEDFEIANFGDWRDPSSYVFTPSGNTPYVIMWHDIYFRGKYIAFIGHKDTAIPTSMTAGDRPTKDSVVNVYGNDAMISGSVEDGYTLEADYGNGSWLREEKIGDSRTVLPFECYLRANATTTPIFKVVRKHDTTTGIDQTENRESRIENRKLIRDGQVVILRDNKMYNVLGMEIQ